MNFPHILRRQFGCGIQQTPALLECLVEEKGVLGLFNRYSRLARDVVL